jgi:hypothetical protein
MRLLDLIAQGCTKTIHIGNGGVLPGAEAFKDAVRTCPVRYVLADDLARCATQFAFAEGDRLSSCLDLIRVPARRLWVEWMDAPRNDQLQSIAALELERHDLTRRAGALLTAAADCRSGEIRTFWSTHADLAYVSPVVIQFDLDDIPKRIAAADSALDGGWAAVTAPQGCGLEQILEHVRFRFDVQWSAYYRSRCLTSEMRDAVLRRNLGTCAFDPPMLFALFLLFSARDALPLRTVDMGALNRARSRKGKPPLLEHVEVSAPLWAPSSAYPSCEKRSFERRRPRLHHVCGHIVRRGATVFWRAPHLRGSARLGQVRTRTVELSFVDPVHGS